MRVWGLALLSPSVDDDQLFQHICALCPAVQTLMTESGRFFFHDDDRTWPFMSIVMSDAYDTASGLDRDGVYRLDIGVGRGTYTRLFGQPPPQSDTWRIVQTGFDYRRLDLLMPHPMYSPRSWVCVLNPSAATVRKIEPLIDEACREATRHAEDRAALRQMQSKPKGA